MGGFLIRGWGLLHPVSDANSTLARRATLPSRSLHEPQTTTNQRSVIAVRVSTSSGAVSTPGISVFVPGLLEL